MEPDCNYDEIKPSISTELAHKRVSELRQGNSATIAITLEEFETSVPLVNAPGTMEETTGAAIDGTGKNIDQVISDMDEISSDGCTSKIPLVPTVSVYILIVIMIGITLAFNKKKTENIPNIGNRLKCLLIVYQLQIIYKDYIFVLHF